MDVYEPAAALQVESRSRHHIQAHRVQGEKANHKHSMGRLNERLHALNDLLGGAVTETFDKTIDNAAELKKSAEVWAEKSKLVKTEGFEAWRQADKKALEEMNQDHKVVEKDVRNQLMFDKHGSKHQDARDVAARVDEIVKEAPSVVADAQSTSPEASTEPSIHEPYNLPSSADAEPSAPEADMNKADTEVPEAAGPAEASEPREAAGAEAEPDAAATAHDASHEAAVASEAHAAETPEDTQPQHADTAEDDAAKLSETKEEPEAAAAETAEHAEDDASEKEAAEQHDVPAENQEHGEETAPEEAANPAENAAQEAAPSAASQPQPVENAAESEEQQMDEHKEETSPALRSQHEAEATKDAVEADNLSRAPEAQQETEPAKGAEEAEVLPPAHDSQHEAESAKDAVESER